MQIEGRPTKISHIDRSDIDEREKSIRDSTWKCRAPKKAPASIKLPRNDYLKQTFSNIRASEVGSASQFISEDQKDPVFLYKSAENYFRLMNKELDVILSGCFETDAFNLYHTLRKHIPEHIGINYEIMQGKTSIILFDTNIEFPSYTLFFIPIRGIETMNERLRKSFMRFLSFIRQSQKIDIPNEHQDFCFVVDEYAEEFDEMYREEDNYKEISELRVSYEKGKIFLLFDEIASCKVAKEELDEELRILLQESDKEDIPLINEMINGVDILSKGCIFDYDYCHTHNMDGENDAIDFERSFCFCWGNEETDFIVQAAIEAFNNDSQELELYEPAEWLVLTPELDKLFTTDDFAEKFAKWYFAFYNELENYM